MDTQVFVGILGVTTELARVAMVVAAIVLVMKLREIVLEHGRQTAALMNAARRNVAAQSSAIPPLGVDRVMLEITDAASAVRAAQRTCALMAHGLATANRKMLDDSPGCADLLAYVVELERLAAAFEADAAGGAGPGAPAASETIH